MKNLQIVSGCVGCGSCEALCPEVFEVEEVALIKKDVNLDEHKECIREAARICPVRVIKYED